jgi:hypothetical protein
MKSATTPPVFSLDGEAARQPPDEWGKKSPGKCDRQPNHQTAVPLDGLALIQKRASILADEEKSEQSPAGRIRQPTDQQTVTNNFLRVPTQRSPEGFVKLLPAPGDWTPLVMEQP